MTRRELSELRETLDRASKMIGALLYSNGIPGGREQCTVCGLEQTPDNPDICNACGGMTLLWEEVNVTSEVSTENTQRDIAVCVACGLVQVSSPECCRCGGTTRPPVGNFCVPCGRAHDPGEPCKNIPCGGCGISLFRGETRYCGGCAAQTYRCYKCDEVVIYDNKREDEAGYIFCDECWERGQ